jgi:NADH dehydrogenase [ubiquinone] 1 alpha subcomplex assembly factor 7
VSLKDRLVRDIREDGPMTVADYMTRCLHDPLDGYYATRPALGETGDFITAPLISQMFGEIVGAWTHEIWVRLGAPKRFRLIELGPGTGVLMADILRVSRLDAAFAAAWWSAGRLSARSRPPPFRARAGPTGWTRSRAKRRR